MHVEKWWEVPYEPALFGFGLSMGLTSGYKHWKELPQELIDRLHKKAWSLRGHDGGHNKYLRQMELCLDLDFPRYLWPEFDTYKVGTTAQSESTMHTIHKRDLTPEDFELDETEDIVTTLQNFNTLRYAFLETKDKKLWRRMIQILPQSFLQRRIVTLNYANLRNILRYRRNHRLIEWAFFEEQILKQVDHPEFLQFEEGEDENG